MRSDTNSTFAIKVKDLNEHKGDFNLEVRSVLCKVFSLNYLHRKREYFQILETISENLLKFRHTDKQIHFQWSALGDTDGVSLGLCSPFWELPVVTPSGRTHTCLPACV